MRIDIHVHHHAPPVDTRALDKLDLILACMENLMTSLERIEAAVAKQTTLEDSALALITDLKHQVADALSGTRLPPDVEARLAAIFPTLEANNDRVTAALVANTDAAPAPTIDPLDQPKQMAAPEPEVTADPGEKTNPGA